jgi:hypothetical protein
MFGKHLLAVYDPKVCSKRQNKPYIFNTKPRTKENHKDDPKSLKQSRQINTRQQTE